jgi:RHS repeat-associated protein
MTDPLYLKTGNAREQHYFYQNDHLGTPQKLMSTTGAIVWDARYEAFGQATPIPLLPGVQPIDNPLRFAGQYHDPETGWHYNWHRYYAPELGRYITSDPIGLEGGLNTYAYVGGNPVGYIDPIGLVRWRAAGWAALGVVGNGFGMLAGAGLLGAPEPTMLTKVLGTAVLTKSTIGWGLNWTNLILAFTEDEADYDQPSSAGRFIAYHYDPCNSDLQRFADVAELGLDFASGRAIIGHMPRSSGYLWQPVGYPALNSNQVLPLAATYADTLSPSVKLASDGMQAAQSIQYGADAYSVNSNSGCGCSK